MNPGSRPCEVCSAQSFLPLFEKEGHPFVRCSSCGLERIDPQPTDEQLGAIYGKAYYDAWGLHRDPELVGNLKRQTFIHVLDRVPVRDGSLMDCGAATGFLLEVARERGFDPYGVELSQFGADEIARKFGAQHSFHGQVGDAHFDGKKEGDFSVVTMCDFIEHVRDPRAALARARDFLKPGGVLAVTTPDTGSLSHKVMSKGWTHYKVEHLFYFDRANLSRLLHDVGFQQVELRSLHKRLSVSYLQHQFEVYPHPVLRTAARALSRLVPDALQSRAFPILTGELLAIAHR